MHQIASFYKFSRGRHAPELPPNMARRKAQWDVYILPNITPPPMFEHGFSPL